MPRSSLRSFSARHAMQRQLRGAPVRPVGEGAAGFDGPAAGPGSEDPRQFARAVDYIERNLTSRALTPASVAEAVHVSRSTLYRMFGPSGGVNRYIVRARLDRAWQALAGPARTRRVSEVAFALGFQSDAHFCRAFRRAFGVTPGHAGGAVTPSDRPAEGPDPNQSDMSPSA